MNYDNISIDDLIASYNRAGQPANIRNAIIGKIVEARTFLRRYRSLLTDQNIADLNANIAKAKIAIGD